MASWYTSRLFGVLACAAGAVAAGVVVWLVFFRSPPDDPDVDRPFRECATEVGLSWRMRFLSTEQGETFKINLYDHGCGLAVGDFDGDGHEDIYFCNQLG